MGDTRHKCEHLERTPRRLSTSREAFLRDYPRHYDAGDTVHELLSEIDFLRAERKGLMQALEQLARSWRHQLNTTPLGHGTRYALKSCLAQVRNLISEHGGDEKAGGVRDGT